MAARARVTAFAYAAAQDITREKIHRLGPLAGPDCNLPSNVRESAFREYIKGRLSIDPGQSEEARKATRKAYLEGQACVFNEHPQVCVQARTQANMAVFSDQGAPTNDENLASSGAQCLMMARLFMSGVNLFEHNDGSAPPPDAPPPSLPPPSPYDPSVDLPHATAAAPPPSFHAAPGTLSS